MAGKKDKCQALSIRKIPFCCRCQLTGSFLSPLAGLGQLEAVMCRNNPVDGRTELKNVIVTEEG